MKEIDITANYTIKEKVLLILMGMCSFSTFSSTLSTYVLHFPLTLPEPFFILFLLLLKKRFLPIRWDKGLFVVLVFILLLSILWSQLLGTFPLYDVLSSARGYLYLFLFLCVFKCNNKLSLGDLLYISFGTIIGWLIASIMGFNEMLSNPNDPVQTYGNMIAVAFFITTTILSKKWRFLLIGFLLLVGIALMSGIRRAILVDVIAFLFAGLAYVIKNKKSISRIIVITIVLVIPLTIFIPLFEKYAEENVPIIYYRLFTKTEESLKGEAGVSDEYRVDSFKEFRDDFSSYLMPRGMVSNQYNKDPKTGIFMDFPFLALSYIFGLPIAILIVVFFVVKAFKSLHLYRTSSDSSPGIFAIVTLIMFILLFVEGSFLVHTFTTPFTGLCLGKVLFYGKNYNQLKRL